MPAVKDPYKTLGVAKNAPDAEIKKAYRKHARENHPDRNPGDAAAEERFKDIQGAYDILSDPEKRKDYDSGGGIFGGAGGFDPGAFRGNFGGIGDIFSDLFGGAGRGGPAGSRPERGRDLETDVHVSFEQAMEGAQVPVSVPLSAPCPTCHGTGAKPGTSPTICSRCQGRGVEAESQGLFSISQPCRQCGGTGTEIKDPCPTCHGTGAKPGTSPTICSRCQGRGVEAESQGLFSISQPCRQCGGTGTEIKDPCPTCNGSGQTRQVKRYRVNIPAGVKNGSRVRLAGKGEAGPRGGPSGDLYVITRVAESPVFKRKGNNVEVEVPITIAEAIRGATIEVPTLSGTKRIRVRREAIRPRLRSRPEPRA